MPNTIFFRIVENKITTFYRWLHLSTAYDKHQNGLLSQNFIFQFMPFSPGSPLNQLEQFVSLGCFKKWYLFFFQRRPKLSENTSVEIHCNIRSSKGVLSYTAAINEHGECKQFWIWLISSRKKLTCTVYLESTGSKVFSVLITKVWLHPHHLNLEPFSITCVPSASTNTFFFSWLVWLLD